MSFLKEIHRRRTFGIISHPDAGKTTLTEKLLLLVEPFKRQVRYNKIKKEPRVISWKLNVREESLCSTSVLAFNYKENKYS
jgi:peptide chain release factor 3